MPERDADPAVSAVEPAPPRAVAGFQLLRKIGAGGMSAVYQSFDVTAARPVAVKLLSDALAGRPEFVSRFYREARLSSTLEHPNLVRGFASGFDRATGKHYLVMELVGGPNAHAALERLGRFPVGAAVRVGIDIAHALEFLHERRYVHRDVKPDNILVNSIGDTKIIDFAISRKVPTGFAKWFHRRGRPQGTPSYMSPEQIRDEVVDGRADIYSYGCMLYELTTGRPPFRGTSQNDLLSRHFGEKPAPPSAYNPDLTDEFSALVLKLIAKKKTDRPDNFHQVLIELQKVKQIYKSVAEKPTEYE